ncbi:MAG: GSU2403 family nucleotidyltransferase fold protein [Pseudomonadota bacterium]
MKDAAVSEISGTLERRARGNKTYIYERLRTGSKSTARYIGEAIPELELRLQSAEALRNQSKARKAEQMRLVRVLRAEGYLPLDAKTGSLLSAMVRVGVFRLGGTLVGTNAFRLYEGELGVRIGADRLARTDDIDIASFEHLSVALNDTVVEPVGDALKALSFAPVPSLDAKHIWRWADTSRGTLVEFLTTAMKGDEELKPLPSPGVSAQGLHYLNFLLADPIKAVALYRSGILVQIPRPEAYAIHKLIVADRRRGDDRLKAEKDRQQAAFLIEVLAEDRPDELAEAYEDAMSRGDKWRTRIAATLKRMPDTKARLDRVTAGT